jgi:hypothetical protein
MLIMAAPATVLAADTEAPQTQLSLSGILGANSWYISTVNATLRAQDLLSGPASTTYQLDTNTPVTVNFSGTANAILNPSFEDGSFYTITNWDKVSSSGSFLYQSSTPSKFGFGSAAVVTFNSEFQYWTNVNYAVPVSVGQTYTASVWVKTVNLSNGPGAWMEAWASDSTGIKSDQQMVVSSKIIGDWDWQQINIPFTVPDGYDHVYLKMGDQAGAGVAFFDGVTLNAGTDGLTQFSIVENGTHSLVFHSNDNAGNIESVQTKSPIKIDTVKPQDWGNFNYSNTGNNHTFTMWASVRDLTSGINPATAQFQTFDKDNCDCWSAWMNVSSITRVDTGAVAPAGYTGYVKLTTPSYDFGNSSSSTLPQVQFRIDDMAASAGISPIYALFGPWVKFMGGGDIYSGGTISIPGTTPTGQYSADGVVASGGDTISGVVSLKQWYVKPYAIPKTPVFGLQTYITNIELLKTKAQPLTGGRLPSTTGVYLFNGKYTIDSNTLNAGFQNAVYNAVIIVNGDLAINQDYQLNASSGVVFMVTGQIIYSGSISQTAGVLIAAGSISTGGGSSQLTHKGSLVALGGFTLGRDLGRKGNPNNTTTPAETIIFQPQYLSNQGLASLLAGGGTADFQWQEAP